MDTQHDQNDGNWKRQLPLDMAIVGIYVRFLGCMNWVGAILGALATG